MHKKKKKKEKTHAKHIHTVETIGTGTLYSIAMSAAVKPGKPYICT
jgi:hypothetical protein